MEVKLYHFCVKTLQCLLTSLKIFPKPRKPCECSHHHVSDGSSSFCLLIITLGHLPSALASKLFSSVQVRVLIFTCFFCFKRCETCHSPIVICYETCFFFYTRKPLLGGSLKFPLTTIKYNGFLPVLL